MRVQAKVEGVLRMGNEVWLSGFGTMSIDCPRITLSILFFLKTSNSRSVLNIYS